MRYISDKKHILRYKSFSENRAVYKMMGKVC